jgi:hypothetical protein
MQPKPNIFYPETHATILNLHIWAYNAYNNPMPYL